MDLNTFRLTGFSHPVKVKSIDNVYSFEFNNILLPDSNVNEFESHGFVRFTIKPKQGLAENTRVENTGYIYFDFNPPIITNTTFNTYVTEYPTVTGTTEVQDLENQAAIIPNPFTNEALIKFENENGNEFTLQSN